MIERISETAAGVFDKGEYEAGCSVDRIDDVVSADGKKVCDFYVIKNGGLIKGVVYSSDHRVRVNTQAFSGSSCRIEYEIDARGLRNGDVIDGRFSIINDCGEWFIPYHISVIYVRNELAESMKSLESFSELAKTDWDAALRLCESAEFLTLPFMQTPEYAAIYQALRNTAGRNNLLEEFLIGCGIKQPVTVSITGPQDYVRSEISSSDFISIKRDAWGYVNLKVTTDSEFIILMKNTIGTEDFEDDICTIEYKVDAGKLHSGKNFGRVIIESVRQRFVINVNIDAKGQERDKKAVKFKNSLVRAMKYYIRFYTRQNEPDKYLELLKNELYEMIPLDEKNIRIILAVAWVSIKKGDMEDAARILNRVRSSIIDGSSEISVNYCIFYYLCYLAQVGNESLESLLRLLNICYSETKDLAVFRLLLVVEPEWEAEPVKKLEVIKKAFDNGCHAPWLYTEACRVYIMQPELMESLGSFELNCLWFGAKEELLPFELAEMVSAFALRKSGSDKLYLRILMRLYNTHKSIEILKGICNILLKSDMRQPECFEWYERGVEYDIKLTRLYEYYIYTMPQDFDSPIPRMVLLYFSYTNTLDVPSRIIIYRNVIRYYLTDEQIRMCYAGQIEAFTIDQLLKGYVDEGMAELYNNVIYEDMIDRRIALVLPKMLYAASFSCANKKIRKIAVCYKELNYEQILVPWNGTSYTVLFSDNYVAVGIDADGKRYAGLDIKVKQVFENKGLAALCKRIVPNQEIIRMRESLELFDKERNMESGHYGMLELLQNENIRESFKADIVSRLTDYYKIRADRAPEALLGVDKELIGFDDRQEFIDMLAIHGKFQRAFDLMQLYGWMEVSDKSLMETASRMIVELRFSKNTMLLEMAGACFERGCFNQRILEYLLNNFNGDSYTMMGILRAAVSGGGRRYDFAERLLSQLIFTGQYECLDEVFQVYYEENQKDELVVQAYLAIRNRAYLTENDEVPELVHSVTEQFVMAGRKMADISKLALCKYYSGLPTLTEEQKSLCSKFVHAYCREGIIFSFFQKLGRFIRLPDGLEDRIIIEYRAKKDDAVRLRSRILPDDREWHEEVMTHMFEGFFVKVITLLRGEILDYEIYAGDKQPAVSGSESLCDESAGILGTGRNVMINRLLEAKEKKDMGSLVLNAQSYVLLDEITSEVFTLL